MLLASSVSAFDTSAASLMQGSLNRTRTDCGVWKKISKFGFYSQLNCRTAHCFMCSF